MQRYDIFSSNHPEPPSCFERTKRIFNLAALVFWKDRAERSAIAFVFHFRGTARSDRLAELPPPTRIPVGFRDHSRIDCKPSSNLVCVPREQTAGSSRHVISALAEICQFRQHVAALLLYAVVLVLAPPGFFFSPIWNLHSSM